MDTVETLIVILQASLPLAIARLSCGLFWVIHGLIVIISVYYFWKNKLKVYFHLFNPLF